MFVTIKKETITDHKKNLSEIEKYDINLWRSRDTELKNGYIEELFSNQNNTNLRMNKKEVLKEN